MSSFTHLSARFRTTLAVSALAAIGCGLPGSAASAEAVRFAIEGVGDGTFGKAALSVKPGAPPGDERSRCLTLGEGSIHNTDALLAWMRSNSAGAALATRPDATVTVLDDRAGLKQGVYRLTDITVESFRLVSDRDLTDPRLEGAEINCETVDVAL